MITFPMVAGKNRIWLIFPKLDPRESGAVKIWEPLSIITLANHLLDRGFAVEIYDSRTRDDFDAELERIGQDLLLVGISSMAGYQVVEGHEFSKRVKALFGGVPVVWGGWFPTVSPDLCLKSPEIDVVLKGQGEELLPEIAQRIQSGRPIGEVEGISFKENGKIEHNPLKPLADPNRFLSADYTLLDRDRYTLDDGVLHYVSSVGCPHACTFCGVSPYVKRRWYGLNPDRVMGELKTLHETFRFKELILYDSTFFVEMERAKEILEGMIHAGMGFRWFANAHVDQVVQFDDEMIDLLKRSNCFRTEIGMESGSKRMRALFDKEFDDKELDGALGRLAHAGISVICNYIIAPPMENRDDFMQTLHSMIRVKQINPDNLINMYRYTSIPGTPLEALDEQEGESAFPESLEGWDTYYHRVADDLATPWQGKRDALGRQPMLFYFKAAHMAPSARGGMIKRILKCMAAFRLKHELFLLPVEWHLFKNLEFSS